MKAARTSVRLRVFQPVLARLRHESIAAQAAADGLGLKRTWAVHDARQWFGGYRRGLMRAALIIREHIHRK